MPNAQTTYITSRRTRSATRKPTPHSTPIAEKSARGGTTIAIIVTTRLIGLVRSRTVPTGVEPFVTGAATKHRRVAVPARRLADAGGAVATGRRGSAAPSA